MSCDLKKGVLFFLLGFVAINAVAFSFYELPEEYPDRFIEKAPYKVIVWKLKVFPLRGDRIMLRAQHRLAGEDGRFRFVVFSVKSDARKKPKFIRKSRFFEARKAGDWSTWRFNTRRGNIFVGVAWTSDVVPVFIQKEAWSSNGRFYNYAHVGGYKEDAPILRERLYDIRANFRADLAETDLPWGPMAWISSLLLCAGGVGILAWRRRFPDGLLLISLVAGIVFGYRLWASFLPAFWNWGAYVIAYLPRTVSLGLVVAVPVVCLAGAYIPWRNGWRRVVQHPAWFWGLCVVLPVLAWVGQCKKNYGDYYFGYLNEQHAPLLFTIMTPLMTLGKMVGVGKVDVARYFSIVLLFPFLFALRRCIRGVQGDRTISLLALLFFLSLSTLQDFFGYAEVYAVPMVLYLLFACAAFETLEGRRGLFLPTIISFVAYLAHLTEGVLIFSLAFLWIHELAVGRLPARTCLKTILKISAVALVLLALVSVAIFVLDNQSNLERFAAKYPFYGLDYLWGGPRMARLHVRLPLFSGHLAHPNGTYPVFSVDNAIKVLNFTFFYSAFVVLIPFLLLVRNRFRDLRDTRVAFLVVGLLSYLGFLALIRVGFYPQIRDWDLFSPLSIIGAMLTFLLCHKYLLHRGLLIITLVNLLQTVPWIVMNHGRYPFPW